MIDCLAQKKNSMTNQVFAVNVGCKVTFSSIHDQQHQNYQLDNTKLRPAWSTKKNEQGQWIQVMSVNPKIWKGIITQGRGDTNQRVLKYRVIHSHDGQIWQYADDGREYPGNFDNSTKIRNNFKQPIEAKYIRILPTSWQQHISLRFDAIYLE